MTNNPPTEKQSMLYLDWFLDQYDIGLPNLEGLACDIAYLEGLMAASPQQFAGLKSVQGYLRCLEVIVRTLRQYQVRMPHG